MKRHVVLLVALALFVTSGLVTAAEEWKSLDIGTEGGKTKIVDGTITITADGADIWNKSDEFRFVYQKGKGDLEIVTKLHSLKEVQEWSKAGAMFRETLEPGSAFVYVVASPKHGVTCRYRPFTDDDATRPLDEYDVPDFEYPVYLKLTKREGVFTAEYREEGEDEEWEEVGELELEMEEEEFYVGLCVTSHLAEEYTEAKFSDVKIGKPKEE